MHGGPPVLVDAPLIPEVSQETELGEDVSSILATQGHYQISQSDNG